MRYENGSTCYLGRCMIDNISFFQMKNEEMHNQIQPTKNGLRRVPRPSIYGFRVKILPISDKYNIKGEDMHPVHLFCVDDDKKPIEVYSGGRFTEVVTMTVDPDMETLFGFGHHKTTSDNLVQFLSGKNNACILGMDRLGFTGKEIESKGIVKLGHYENVNGKKTFISDAEREIICDVFTNYIRNCHPVLIDDLFAESLDFCFKELQPSEALIGKVSTASSEKSAGLIK